MHVTSNVSDNSHRAVLWRSFFPRILWPSSDRKSSQNLRQLFKLDNSRWKLREENWRSKGKSGLESTISIWKFSQELKQRQLKGGHTNQRSNVHTSMSMNWMNLNLSTGENIWILKKLRAISLGSSSCMNVAWWPVLSTMNFGTGTLGGCLPKKGRKRKSGISIRGLVWHLFPSRKYTHSSDGCSPRANA